MNFLAPLFLAGLAAVALPLWLHLLQTQTPERQPFSSAMLLRMSEQRIHLRRRLRYLALLALRIALLVLLALAFAEPLWERSERVTPAADTRLNLVIIDTSLSMGQGTLLERAVAEARSLIGNLPPVDSVRLVAAGAAVEVLATAVPAAEGGTDSRAVLAAALDNLEAGDGRLDFGVLAAAIPDLAGTGTEPVVTHFISDFQASALPSQFGALVPRPLAGNRSHELVLHPLAGEAVPNWTIESLRRTQTGIDVGVRGFDTPARELTVAMTLNEAREERLTRQVPASGVAEFSFALPDVAFATGDNRVTATLEPADGLLADDRRHLVVPNTPSQPVPLLTSRVDSPLVRYLSTAFATAARQYRIEPVTFAGFDPRTLERHDWIVIDDLGGVGEALATALAEYVNRGGAILAATGERALALQVLPVTGHRLGTGSLVSGGTPFTVGRIDTGHPLLAATDGWRGISVTRLAPVVAENADRVLIAMEDGRPLLLERPSGSGRVLLLASSLDNTWNDLPVYPVFVSFIAEAARYLSGDQALNRQQTAGASLPLSLTGSTSGQVVDPAGQTILSLADTRQVREVRLGQTGFYQVYTPGREALIAVNADPAESDLKVMTAAQVERWQQAATRAPAQAAALTENLVRPPPVELWRYLLLLLVLVVLAESLLGNRHLKGHLHDPMNDAGRAPS